MTDHHMTPKGYNVLRSNEGRSLRAYKDAVGVWTIGFGNTNSDASVLGFTITSGVRITAEQADSLLKIAMEKRYEPTVNAALGKVDAARATDGVYDACYDYVYNLGTGGFASKSWFKSWAAGGSASGILAYDHAGGKVLAGLTRRRKRELAMIERSDYGPEGSAAPMDLVLSSTGQEIGVTKAPGAAAPGATTVIPASGGMLRLGMSGPEVKAFQEGLVDNGQKCPVNGTFDEATKQAVLRFQTAHPQLDVDGVGGPATRAAVQRGVDMTSKAKRATVAGLGSAAPVTADQTLNSAPFLPTWSVALLGVAFVVTVAYVGWQYRDEIVAYFRKAKS